MKYIYLSAVLKYSFEVLLLYVTILNVYYFYFITVQRQMSLFLLHYIYLAALITLIINISYPNHFNSFLNMIVLN